MGGVIDYYGWFGLDHWFTCLGGRCFARCSLCVLRWWDGCCDSLDSSLSGYCLFVVSVWLCFCGVLCLRICWWRDCVCVSAGLDFRFVGFGQVPLVTFSVGVAG